MQHDLLYKMSLEQMQKLLFSSVTLWCKTSDEYRGG